MIQKARGETPTEATFHPTASAWHPPSDVVAVGRVRPIIADVEAREIVVELATGALLAVVTVLGSPYVSWQESAYPALKSKYGRMAQPGSFGGGLHAIVLIARTSDGFFALDPYFPAHAPLAIDDDAFASLFGGHAWVADP